MTTKTKPKVTPKLRVAPKPDQKPLFEPERLCPQQTERVLSP
jgi:hypothetical protein